MEIYRWATVSPEQDCSEISWYNIVPVQHTDSYHYLHHTPDTQFVPTAANTVDNQANTAWIAESGYRDNENWIRWTFAGKTVLRLLCIKNGFPVVASIYKKYGRVKTAWFEGCAEAPKVQITLKNHLLRSGTTDRDYDAWESVPFICTVRKDPTSTNSRSITLHITSVYAGAASTVSIADVAFYEGFRWTDRPASAGS